MRTFNPGLAARSGAYGTTTDQFRHFGGMVGHEAFIPDTFAPPEKQMDTKLTNFAATDGWIPHEGPNSNGVTADHFQNKNICSS